MNYLQIEYKAKSPSYQKSIFNAPTSRTPMAQNKTPGQTSREPPD